MKLVRATPTPARLGLAFGIMLVNVLGLSILYPVMPFVVRRYDSGALTVTMLAATYAAAQTAIAPALGRLSDRYGRRAVLLACLLGSAIGQLVFGLGGSLWVLFLSRVIAGIAGGTQAALSAYIIDVSAAAERMNKLALIGVAWGVGLVVGPALGTLFGGANPQAPALVAAALTFGMLIVALVWLPESLPPDRRDARRLRAGDLNPIAFIAEMALRPGLGALLLVLCLFNLAYLGISSVSSLFVIDRFAAGQGQVGLLLMLTGLSLAAAQAAVSRAHVALRGAHVLAVISLAGQAVVALAICAVPQLWPIYGLTAATAALSGLTSPALYALTANRVDPSDLGGLMGVMTALTSAMSVAGALWAGAAYDRVAPGAPYWIGAVLLLLAALMLGRRGVRGSTGMAVPGE